MSFDPDDIIVNNQIGFHSKNQDQMKKDLHKLISDDSLRMVMGEKARKYAIENHSIINNVIKYDKKFNKIIYEQDNKKNK